MLHKRMSVSLLLPCEGEEMTILDKIVSVCCILLNMCPSVGVKPDEKEKFACLNISNVATDTEEMKCNWLYL